MLEEALPLAIGVGAALLPAMAFGGLAAARGFMYLGAGASFPTGYLELNCILSNVDECFPAVHTGTVDYQYSMVCVQQKSSTFYTDRIVVTNQV